MSEIPSQRKCSRCGDAMPAGVRFCVACGTHHLDPDAGALATGSCEMQSSNYRAFMKRLAFWWRFITTGLYR